MGICFDRELAPEVYDRIACVCSGCGREKLKAEVISIYAKRKRTNPLVIAHLCEDCYEDFCKRYEVEDKI